MYGRVMAGVGFDDDVSVVVIIKPQHTQHSQEPSSPNLFATLPFHPEPINEDIRLRPYATLSFIPGVSHQLKRAFSKAGCNLYNKSGQKLQNILCAKNKTRPPPCKCKGIYKFQCSCSEKAIYVGETRRSIDTRTQEHKKAVENQKWSHSGLTQHKETC